MRAIKSKEVYLRNHETVQHAKTNIASYLLNTQRLDQSQNIKRPLKNILERNEK